MSGISLKELDLSDAEQYYGLYNLPIIQEVFDYQIFQNRENPLQFTKRILSSCQYIWTIRKAEDQRIIGDCALHQYDETKLEVYFGGVLHPDYWGKGYMGRAFEHIKVIAKESLNIKFIKASTTPENQNAIRFAQKMGFTEFYKTEKEVCFVYGS